MSNMEISRVLDQLKALSRDIQPPEQTPADDSAGGDDAPSRAPAEATAKVAEQREQEETRVV